jgi:uncharacterized protein
MKRDLYLQLQRWKISPRRKPLLLQGARQTGKTYLLQKFGQEKYQSVIYCNFEENPNLDQFFQRDLDPDRILAELSVYFDREIRPGKDLVIFDEVQVSNHALNSLKYFTEKRNDIHIAAAGSLLGLKLSTPGSFPVGKVSFQYLHPMTFLEFLEAMGEGRYRRLIEGVNKLEPLTEAFHNRLIDLLRQYYFTGGMPEAVGHFAGAGDAQGTREIQQNILRSYMLDFAKHAPSADIPKLTSIWESIPKHLARENKKFIFSAIRKGARAREYENALVWLRDAGLVYRATAAEKDRIPLKHYADPGCFKIYALDVGLLGAMTDSPVRLLASGGRLFNEYEGAFVVNYVAQQLVSCGTRDLYYWRSSGGRAELDFLVESDDLVFPLEVKAGINPRSKSLKSYDAQFSPPVLLRFNLLNFHRDGKLCNIPLYAVSQIYRLLNHLCD